MSSFIDDEPADIFHLRNRCFRYIIVAVEDTHIQVIVVFQRNSIAVTGCDLAGFRVNQEFWLLDFQEHLQVCNFQVRVRIKRVGAGIRRYRSRRCLQNNTTAWSNLLERSVQATVRYGRIVDGQRAGSSYAKRNRSIRIVNRICCRRNDISARTNGFVHDRNFLIPPISFRRFVRRTRSDCHGFASMVSKVKWTRINNLPVLSLLDVSIGVFVCLSQNLRQVLQDTIRRCQSFNPCHVCSLLYLKNFRS
ncbi:hypothetical protein D3C86_1226420 [compost metagenome]